MKDNYDLTDLAEEPEIRGSGRLSDNAEKPAPFSPQRSDFDASQWTLAGPDWFHASGRSFGWPPSGTYRVEATDRGVFAVRQKVISDRLSVLPGTSNEKVLEDIRRFWASKARYEKVNVANSWTFVAPASE